MNRFFNKFKRQDEKSPSPGGTPASSSSEKATNVYSSATPSSVSVGRSALSSPVTESRSGGPPSDEPRSGGPPSGMSLFSGLNLAGTTTPEDEFTESSSFSFISQPLPSQELSSSADITSRPAAEGSEHPAGTKHLVEEKGFDFVTHTSQDTPTEGFGFVTHTFQDTPTEGFGFITHTSQDTPTEGFDNMTTPTSPVAQTLSMQTSTKLPASVQTQAVNPSLVVQTTTQASSSAIQTTTQASSSAIQTTTQASSSAIQTTTQASLSAIQTTTQGSLSVVQTTTQASSSVVQTTTQASSSVVQTTTQASSSAVEPAKKGTRKKKSKAIRPGLSTPQDPGVSTPQGAGLSTPQGSTHPAPQGPRLSGPGGSSEGVLTSHHVTPGDSRGGRSELVDQPTQDSTLYTGLEEKAALVTGIEKSHESVEQSQAATKDNQQHDGDIRIAQCNKVIEQPAKVNEQAISTDDSLCTENEETTPDTKEGEVKTSAHTYPPAGASPPDTPPASEQNQRSNDRTIEEEAKQELNGSKSSQDTPQVWQERTNNLLTTNSKRISEINHSMAERRGESTHQFQELLSRAQLRIQALTEQRRLKEEEAVALCEENYSRAEELREQIEEEKMILSTSHPVVDDLLQVLPSIEDKFTEALQKELTDRTAVMEGVTQYREELANVMATLEGKHQDFMDLENENLKKFKEKVKEQEKEVAKQSKEVMMAEEELKEMIQDKCQEFQTKKDELTAEMETVEEEIAELERRLKALREQRTALSIEIKKQERGISEAQRSFAKDQRKMDEQKNDVAKQQQQLEMEQSTLERMEKEMEVSTETYSRSAKEFSVVMEMLVSQVNMHKSRLDSVAMEIEHISSFKDNFLPSFSPSEELQRLLEDEASKTSLVQELADEVVKGQAKLTETRGQLSDVRTSRPQLEDAKKAAITARNYKEAGRLNEELKALLAKETDLAKDIDSLLSELEETSGKLDTVQEELAVTIEARSEAEKSEESSRLQTLSECCQKIEQTMSDDERSEDSPFHVLLQHCLQLLSCFKEEIKANILHL